MKKLMLLLVCSFMMIHAHANESWCGYKDYFRLSDSTHPGIYIASSFSDQDIYLQLIGPRSFIIRDSEACRTGYAHVTITYDNNNWCVLDIKDGPRMMHPSVNASCSGIHYLGTKYDGLGMFSYTIYLD